MRARLTIAMLALVASLTATTALGADPAPKNGPAAWTANGAVTSADVGRSLSAPRSLETSLPPKPKASCHSKWCEKIRTARRVALRIDRGLALFARAHGSPSPLEGHEWAITVAARGQGYSPFALLGIAGKESTLATAADCPEEGGGEGNIYGLGSCGAAWSDIVLCGKRWALSQIRSYADGARFEARFLRCLYRGATTVYDVWQRRYCVDARGNPCPGWADTVSAVMRQYFRSGPGLLWRDAKAAVA